MDNILYTCSCGKSYKDTKGLWRHKNKCSQYISNIETKLEDYDDLIGYEGLYKINKGGSIWSCIYRREMKHQLNEDGYCYVDLSKDGKRSKCFIARLLAKQYIPNDDPLKDQIDHIDRNKVNNSLDNLRWVTQAENLANKNRKGCVYEDKRKDGKVYWKSSYSYYEDGKKIVKQKSSRDKEVVEKWLEDIKQQFA